MVEQKVGVCAGASNQKIYTELMAKAGSKQGK